MTHSRTPVCTILTLQYLVLLKISYKELPFSQCPVLAIISKLYPDTIICRNKEVPENPSSCKTGNLDLLGLLYFISNFAKTSWYINNNGYACLKMPHLLKICTKQIYTS